MSTGKRNVYYFMEFPFDNLVLQDGLEKMKKSDFGDFHVTTKIKNGFDLEDYSIDFGTDQLKTPSITYYIAKEGVSDPFKPSYYMNPILHPRWGDKDINGCLSQTKSSIGSLIHEFFNKFIYKIESLLNELTKQVKTFLLGKKSSQKEGIISSIVNFPKYPDTCGLNAGSPDENQSPGFTVKLWTGDTTDQTKKYNEKKTTDKLIAPQSKTIIFTSFYDLTKQSRTGKNQITDYSYIWPFIYSAKGHSNACPQRKDLLISFSLLAPIIHIKHTKDDVSVNIQLTAEIIKINSASLIRRNKELSDDTIKELKRKTEEAKKEYGIEDDDNNNDNDNDGENNHWRDQRSQYDNGHNKERKLNHGDLTDDEKLLLIQEMENK